jgi:hypothetical protein
LSGAADEPFGRGWRHGADESFSRFRKKSPAVRFADDGPELSVRAFRRPRENAGIETEILFPRENLKLSGRSVGVKFLHDRKISIFGIKK